MKLISKISTKTCKAAPKLKLVEVDGKQVPRCDGDQHLLRIVGIASAQENVDTDFGTSIKFTGQFEGTNISTGEVYRSTVCFLPDTGAGMLSGVVVDDQIVEFAFDIHAEASNNNNGYQYVVEPLIKMNAADPLEQLKLSIASSVKPLTLSNSHPLSNATSAKEPEKNSIAGKITRKKEIIFDEGY